MEPFKMDEDDDDDDECSCVTCILEVIDVCAMLISNTYTKLNGNLEVLHWIQK